MNITSSTFGARNPNEAILWKAHWVEMEVALNGIFHRRRSPLPKSQQYAPASRLIEECVLEGVGAVGYAPKAAEGGPDDKRFAVRIVSRHRGTSVDEIEFDERSPCHVVWDQRADGSWQSNISIPNHILRHIIEFFVTKRIDNIRLSIQVSVLKDQLTGLAFSSEQIPLPSGPDHLSALHTRCRLMSVYAS
jgi:hypothetical protein